MSDSEPEPDFKGNDDDEEEYVDPDQYTVALRRNHFRMVVIALGYLLFFFYKS